MLSLCVLRAYGGTPFAAPFAAPSATQPRATALHAPQRAAGRPRHSHPSLTSMTTATPSSAAPSAAGSALSFINPPGLYDPAPNGYSHVAIVEGPVRTVHVAGQGGEDASGRLAEGFAAQVHLAIANLRTALAAAGATPHDVAKLTVLVVDHTEERLRILGGALRACWGDGVPMPACTLIPVPRLALDGMLFEIDATAVLPVP
ncbi:Enamine deaminase RidA, house cleaning of reactive enamine intermediates, YjgF/YER057c/UK114 family [Paracidovorax konjaci]|uniref:Enamine deaminase RidA, house cleaning of reactive enamine intermediates, YjgF/YER057c/UK114 family n=2 Tax=Paracidovorax konjaci TaxID=32040 RepID=A0A1I1TF01_9BURK|nr:Enamine deaminase RidA, house cleaning of reactive enamine intermediates, YjgF/YER057c/UK114 family [Paracidovorax konjaci]